MKIYRAYCDGVKDPKTGFSASSFLVTEENVIRTESTEKSDAQSSNEAEMRAVLSAFMWVRKNGGERDDRALVYTNLKTIPDAFDKGWLAKWMENDWKNSDGKDVRHRELWEAIWEQVQFFNSDIRHAQKDEFSYFSRLKKRVRKMSRSLDKILQTE